MQKLQRSTCVFIISGIVLGVLYFAKEFLIPLVLALILSMLFINFSNWCERRGLGRGVSSFLSVLVFVMAVVAILLLLSWQLSDLSIQLDEMKKRFMEVLQSFRDWITQQFGISVKQQQDIIESQTSSSSGSENMVMKFASGLMGVLVNTVLVLVYMLLFLYYRTHIKDFLLKIVPDSAERKTDKIVHESAKVSQHYLGGLSLMIIMLWIMYGIGFSIVGVQNAILFAILCGILEIVPFVGNLTGTSITVLAVVAQGGDNKLIFGVLITYVLVQLIQTYVLEPLVVGKQVNINPLFTIMGIVLGELIWGIAGMILAIPVLGIIKIVCDHIPDLKPYGQLIGNIKERKE
ncbi:AI-2E family transporter [Pseudoxanthomonas sp. SGD-10]|nr:AI-2E family transporter [Pseudoxanthomonas sp. SGD-10]